MLFIILEVVYICWSEKNRSPLIRIPAAREEGTRIEIRNPDPSCNPYLALAVILEAGLDGINNKISPPEPVNRNIFNMSFQELNEVNIGTLPGDLMEALKELQKDEIIKSALGEHIYSHFLEAKKIEWEMYRKQVHPWEIKQYLDIF